MMNGERFNDDEAEPDLSRAMFYWWRSATKFDECVNLKMDMPNISKISPTCKILREMERLASIASEGLHELRQKLFTYRSGDMWLPIGGREKKDMDIPPVNTILLVGFHNAGKSSLVNLMYSILGRSGLVPFAQTTQISSGKNYFFPIHKGTKIRNFRHSIYYLKDKTSQDQLKKCNLVFKSRL